jgi:tRNA 2-thiocytidine biosynthesis protein TtcA
MGRRAAHCSAARGLVYWRGYPARADCRRIRGTLEDNKMESAAATLQDRKTRYEDNKLAKRLRRLVGAAIADFGMIEGGDRVMVCLSGGKDSHALLDILLGLREKSPVRFDLLAYNLDQKHPGFPAHVLPDYLRERGVPFHVESRDTYRVVKRVIPEGKTMCSLCSRLRRGNIYRAAAELGATKIALGHHRDDILETFFLNMFYGAKLKGMPPKLASDDGRHIVIRPLSYCVEDDIAEYARVKQFPIIPCDLCGSQPNLQRRAIKGMLREWERQSPGRVQNIFRALQNVAPSHLADRNLFDFAGLAPREAAGGEPLEWDDDKPYPRANRHRSGDAAPA